MTTTNEDKLRLQANGYSVMASRSQLGRFRWWRETGSDGVSVPKRELSETTFGTADEAWGAAASDDRIVSAGAPSIGNDERAGQ